LYIGISNDPEKRLKHHNLGMSKSTRYRRSFRLVFFEECGTDRVQAREKEKYYKSGCGRELIEEKIKSFKLA